MLLSFLSFLFSGLSRKLLEESGGNDLTRASTLFQEMTAGGSPERIAEKRTELIRLCRFCMEQPKYAKENMDKFAIFYCRAQLQELNPEYEFGLKYLLKKERAAIFRAEYLRNTGRRDEARALMLELLSAKKEKANALRQLISCYADEAEYGAGFDACIKWLPSIPKKERAYFVGAAVGFAISLSSEKKAERALSFADRKTKKRLLPTVDMLRSRIAKGRRQSIDLEAYTQKITGALQPQPVLWIPFIYVDVPAAGRCFVGGAKSYDDEELKERKARFFAQIDFSETGLPAGFEKKPYAIRIWISDEAGKGDEGVYGKEHIFVWKGEAKSFSPPVKFNKQLAETMRELNFYMTPLRFKFVPHLEYPSTYSKAAQAAIQAAGEPHSEIIEQVMPLSGWEKFGHRALGPTCPTKKTAGIDEKYDLCLCSFTSDGCYYQFCISSENFKADDFSDVILLKSECKAGQYVKI